METLLLASRKAVLYWVHRRTSQGEAVRLWGTPMSEGDGLAPSAFEYEGALVCISSGERLFLEEVQMGRGHSMHDGFFIGVSGKALQFPRETPFLATSLVALRSIYQGDAVVAPVGIMAEVVRDQTDDNEYFVGCAEWIGVLRVPPADSGRPVRLWAYSDQSRATITDRPLMLLDRDGEFGAVQRLGAR